MVDPNTEVKMLQTIAYTRKE